MELALAFLTLTFLEIVLGVDNIIFISILTNKLPSEIRKKARRLGIALALVFRILMLLSITWIMGFQEALFQIKDHPVSGRDLVLFAGGVFLLWKATKEIYEIMEAGGAKHGQETNVAKSFAGIIVQIALLDIVFSFDSILTAIGMTDNLQIMIAAIVVAMFVMLQFSGPVSKVIEKHPSLQVLALAFLILIGFMLVAESAAQLSGWKTRIEGFLAERLLLQLNPARQRLRPVSDGVDFLGYIVRPFHLLVRRRVVGHLREALRRSERALVGRLDLVVRPLPFLHGVDEGPRVIGRYIRQNAVSQIRNVSDRTEGTNHRMRATTNVGRRSVQRARIEIALHGDAERIQLTTCILR
jgi:predicted tellurium resistance membrane protein TerC